MQSLRLDCARVVVADAFVPSLRILMGEARKISPPPVVFFFERSGGHGTQHELAGERRKEL